MSFPPKPQYGFKLILLLTVCYAFIRVVNMETLYKWLGSNDSFVTLNDDTSEIAQAYWSLSSEKSNNSECVTRAQRVWVFLFKVRKWLLNSLMESANALIVRKVNTMSHTYIIRVATFGVRIQIAFVKSFWQTVTTANVRKSLYTNPNKKPSRLLHKANVIFFSFL